MRIDTAPATWSDKPRRMRKPAARIEALMENAA